MNTKKQYNLEFEQNKRFYERVCIEVSKYLNERNNTDYFSVNDFKQSSDYEDSKLSFDASYYNTYGNRVKLSLRIRKANTRVFNEATIRSKSTNGGSTELDKFKTLQITDDHLYIYAYYADVTETKIGDFIVYDVNRFKMGDLINNPSTKDQPTDQSTGTEKFNGYNIDDIIADDCFIIARINGKKITK